jgi:hypothetical protein
MPDWVLNCAVVSGCHSDRQPNHLTLSQLLPIMFCTCKRCIRTGVNDLSGLYSGASPYLRHGSQVRPELTLGYPCFFGHFVATEDATVTPILPTTRFC